MQQTMTVAQAVIELLKQNGVSCIFGVLGDAVFPFFDELGKQSDIKFYGTSHESGAAFMASYYAKQTGKLGVCVATSGPGAANLVNGLADACFDRAPVLAITGQVQSSKVGTNAKQYINQQQLLQAVTKESQLIINPHSVLPVTAKAIAQALAGKTVTHLSIPKDLFSQPINQPSFPKLPVGDTTPWVGGYANQIEEAVQLLENCKQPVIVLGKGQREWRDLITKAAETLGAAVVTAQQAKGLLPDSHPLVVGGLGEAFLPEVVSAADCFLLVGNASYEMKFLPSQTKLIQLVGEVGQVSYSRADHAVVGDVRQLLKLLSERVTQKKNPAWANKVQQDKQTLSKMRGQQKLNMNAPVHPATLMATMSEVLPKNAVIVCDVGGFIHWFDTYFEAQDHTVLVSSHWRGMGGGLPGALGVAASFPDRKVIALIGDGGFLMSMGELATAAKYNLPATIIVANDGQYNLEKVKMEAQGLKPFGYETLVPDCANVANAFGIKGSKVTKGQELETILADAVSHQGPSLVDVQLEQVALPLIQ